MDFIQINNKMAIEINCDQGISFMTMSPTLDRVIKHGSLNNTASLQEFLDTQPCIFIPPDQLVLKKVEEYSDKCIFKCYLISTNDTIVLQCVGCKNTSIPYYIKTDQLWLIARQYLKIKNINNCVH